MKNAWNDAWCTEVNYMTWTTNKVEPIEGVYQRCMYIVALVNEFLKNIPNAPESIDKPQIRDFPHEVLQTEEKCAFD